MSAHVYVAAPFTEWRLVRTVQAELVRRGATITEDWTAGIESLPPGLTDNDCNDETAIEAALADLNGVTGADACLFLTAADKTKGRGMWVEFGAALACRGYVAFGETDDQAFFSLEQGGCKPRIAVCGPHRDSTIFSRLAKRFADWQDALPYVLGETP